ncbi:hypothetical protein [uncultured Alteromonas sp.]|jgi:hypothetical protein|uniref:hypothetical protein n=1 Tax=uncultured Alteromonas sp. TaxID=179113 RepID=UPI0030D40075|tara:strand:- start:3880 stop:4521 length:642 start_codon:yes stop_codon:yes gene_type:complete
MKKYLLIALAAFSFGTSASVITLDMSQPFVNYGNQFTDGTVTASSDGTSLDMFGNNWVAYNGPYVIDASTILEVTFSSSSIGELHGFGFDNDTVFDTSADFNNGGSRYFQLAGTQTFGVQDFNTYVTEGSTVTFTIDLGNYLTGSFNYLVFINDQDQTGVDGQSLYSISTTDDSFAPVAVPSAPIATVSEPGVLGLMFASVLLLGASRVRKGL